MFEVVSIAIAPRAALPALAQDGLAQDRTADWRAARRQAVADPRQTP